MSECENYPDEALRGIKKSDIEDGSIKLSAFIFSTVEREKNDGYDECSINWRDDDGAIKEIFNKQNDDGTTKYYAAAHFDKHSIDRFFRSRIVIGQFSYERRKVDGNDYHGNLLIKSDLSKSEKRMIQSALCVLADNDVTYQDNC